MANRNLQIEAGQGSYKSGGGIPMHQDHIRLYFLQDSFNAVQNIGRDVKLGLRTVGFCKPNDNTMSGTK